jgi:hypothetical protein|uniref:hypothetical protein n=1 Tax=Prosthecobacter sp. TaxID=1965333 RepID=UPI0037852C6C
MAQRRQSEGGEVSLFPFLSILACLIGALVFMIVVLVMAQMDKAKGRDPEDIRRSQEYIKLKKEIEDRKKLDVVLKDKLATLEEMQKQVNEKEQQFVKLRKLLTTSKDIQEANMKISQQMQKELDDLLTEIEGLKLQQVESKKEIVTLMAEIKKRHVPEDKKIPPVVVQPSGSGMPEDTKVFFVEAGGGALKILGAWGEEYRLSATPEVVVADAKYNHFLAEIAKNPKSLILFLVRDDGAGAFNNGAGRAEADYSIRVGKLPIPGRGVLDLALFEKYRGTIPPPPAVAPTPPAAPGATPPATTTPGATPPPATK